MFGVLDSSLAQTRNYIFKNKDIFIHVSVIVLSQFHNVNHSHMQSQICLVMQPIENKIIKDVIKAKYDEHSLPWKLLSGIFVHLTLHRYHLVDIFVHFVLVW